jgi:hypothetical protein
MTKIDNNGECTWSTYYMSCAVGNYPFFKFLKNLHNYRPTTNKLKQSYLPFTWFPLMTSYITEVQYENQEIDMH